MLALSHDIIICMDDDSIKMGMTEIKLGMTIPMPMLAPLMAKLDPKSLWDICLFGVIVNPKEATKWWIIDYLIKIDNLDTTLSSI